MSQYQTDCKDLFSLELGIFLVYYRKSPGSRVQLLKPGLFGRVNLASSQGSAIYLLCDLEQIT